MKQKLERYQALLQRPISVPARVLLVLAVLSIPLVFQSPLWTMSFQSNQYPDPLRLAIYINQLEGQKTEMRDDLREINSLNHYIGMRALMESDFSEFLWMPFVMGFFALIILRAVVFGTLRDLVDIIVIYAYFGLFSAWNFYNRLYQYGHNLNPEAAIKVEPFTPPFFGRVQIANFWVESFPGGGAYVMALFGLLIAAALVVAFQHAKRLQGAGEAGE
jgi:copper chaperone NosL